MRAVGDKVAKRWVFLITVKDVANVDVLPPSDAARRLQVVLVIDNPIVYLILHVVPGARYRVLKELDVGRVMEIVDEGRRYHDDLVALTHFDELAAFIAIFIAEQAVNVNGNHGSGLASHNRLKHQLK